MCSTSRTLPKQSAHQSLEIPSSTLDFCCILISTSRVSAMKHTMIVYPLLWVVLSSSSLAGPTRDTNPYGPQNYQALPLLEQGSDVATVRSGYDLLTFTRDWADGVWLLNGEPVGPLQQVVKPLSSDGTARMESVGTVTARMKWIGIGAPPPQVRFRVVSHAEYYFRHGAGQLDNGVSTAVTINYEEGTTEAGGAAAESALRVLKPNPAGVYSFTLEKRAQSVCYPPFPERSRVWADAHGLLLIPDTRAIGVAIDGAPNNYHSIETGDHVTIDTYRQRTGRTWSYPALARTLAKVIGLSDTSFYTQWDVGLPFGYQRVFGEYVPPWQRPNVPTLTYLGGPTNPAEPGAFYQWVDSLRGRVREGTLGDPGQSVSIPGFKLDRYDPDLTDIMFGPDIVLSHGKEPNDAGQAERVDFKYRWPDGLIATFQADISFRSESELQPIDLDALWIWPRGSDPWTRMDFSDRSHPKAVGGWARPGVQTMKVLDSPELGWVELVEPFTKAIGIVMKKLPKEKIAVEIAAEAVSLLLGEVNPPEPDDFDLSRDSYLFSPSEWTLEVEEVDACPGGHSWRIHFPVGTTFESVKSKFAWRAEFRPSIEVEPVINNYYDLSGFRIRQHEFKKVTEQARTSSQKKIIFRYDRSLIGD